MASERAGKKKEGRIGSAADIRRGDDDGGHLRRRFATRPPPVHVRERVVWECDGAAHRRRELCSVWTFDGSNVLSI